MGAHYRRVNGSLAMGAYASGATAPLHLTPFLGMAERRSEPGTALAPDAAEESSMPVTKVVRSVLAGVALGAATVGHVAETLARGLLFALGNDYVLMLLAGLALVWLAHG
jgi:hypothetical protein